MMKLPTPTNRPLCGAVVLLAVMLATGAQAQEAPPAPAPAAPESGTEQAPSPPADAAPPMIPSDLERLAEALPSEHRILKAGEESFDVFVRATTSSSPKGALVLIPGDGGLPPTSEGLGALRVELPAHGWSVWLLSTARPPRVQAITRTPSAEQKGDPTADKGNESAAPAQEPSAKDPAEQEADFPAPATPPGLDTRIAERMQDWIGKSEPRIAAVVAEAAKEGPVTLVAEGAAAALLTGFVANGAPGVAGVILIDPVEVQGAETLWPEGFATPVLEVLDAEKREAVGRERRTRANTAGLARYEQLTLPGGYQTEEKQPSMLARRIRGWLLRQAGDNAPAAPESPATPSTQGPEALGPQRS